jgi:hypothetical protein
MDEATRAAVFGNIATLVVFEVGAQDAEMLAEQLGSEVLPSDLLRLPRFQGYIRLSIDGHPSRAFSIRTLPPFLSKSDPSRLEIIRRYCRQRYGRPVGSVERDIATALAA